VIVLGVALEQGKNILHIELADGLAAFDSSSSELAFGFLEEKNFLFDGVVDGEAVDGYVDGLVEAVDAVYGLFFYELLM
jgi:hypothetical protein